MQHTNTSSTSGGSTTSLFYRDLGARWLTTRSKKGIRRSNKNRLTLSKTPIFGWWRPAWNLSFEARVGNVATYNDARYVCIRPFFSAHTTWGRPPCHVYAASWRCLLTYLLLSSYYVLVQSLSLSKLCRTSRASRFTSRTAE